MNIVVSDDRAENIEAAIDDNTKAIYLESIGNPRGNVPDFESISAVAKKHGVALIVDNTFRAAGAIARPIEHGANIVLNSATNLIGGHGNSNGGVIVDAGNFDYGNGRYPLFSRSE